MKLLHRSTPVNRVGLLLALSAGAEFTGVRVQPTAGLEPAANGPLPGNPWEAVEGTAFHAPVGGPLPSPARRFGITDPQQWIDLCG